MVSRKKPYKKVVLKKDVFCECGGANCLRRSSLIKQGAEAIEAWTVLGSCYYHVECLIPEIITIEKIFKEIRKIGDNNNPENASFPDDEGNESMFLSYVQLGCLEAKLVNKLIRKLEKGITK
jgi:hypothetical protein